MYNSKTIIWEGLITRIWNQSSSWLKILSRNNQAYEKGPVPFKTTAAKLTSLKAANSPISITSIKPKWAPKCLIMGQAPIAVILSIRVNPRSKNLNQSSRWIAWRIRNLLSTGLKLWTAKNLLGVLFTTWAILMTFFGNWPFKATNIEIGRSQKTEKSQKLSLTLTQNSSWLKTAHQELFLSVPFLKATTTSVFTMFS